MNNYSFKFINLNLVRLGMYSDKKIRFVFKIGGKEICCLIMNCRDSKSML